MVMEFETGKARISDQHVGVLMVVKLMKHTGHSYTLELLEKVEGVCFLEEIN